jgi:pSer/pThr/pTyr-binding forkhead associated (FHA) protein
MQVVLVMFRGETDRRSFSLAKDVTVLGRREDCDLRIPLGEVSRKHCRLVKNGDELRIEDLGSSNGTWLSGNRVQEAPVAAGDVLRVGPVSFVVQIDGAPADDQIVAPSLQPQQPAEAASADVPAEPNLQTATEAQPVELEEFDPLSALNESASQSAIEMVADDVAGDIDNSGADQPAITPEDSAVDLQEIKRDEPA